MLWFFFSQRNVNNKNTINKAANIHMKMEKFGPSSILI